VIVPAFITILILIFFFLGTGVASSVALPLVSSTTANALVNGAITQTPVSTNTPLSTTARPPSIDRIGSVDSQHSQHSVGSPQSMEWAVPHQTKLKYTQLFNTWDRTRSGFLSGPQARNIMVQSQLPQSILARIWYSNEILLQDSVRSIILYTYCRTKKSKFPKCMSTGL